MQWRLPPFGKHLGCSEGHEPRMYCRQISWKTKTRTIEENERVVRGCADWRDNQSSCYSHCNTLMPTGEMGHISTAVPESGCGSCTPCIVSRAHAGRRSTHGATGRAAALRHIPSTLWAAVCRQHVYPAVVEACVLGMLHAAYEGLSCLDCVQNLLILKTQREPFMHGI